MDQGCHGLISAFSLHPMKNVRNEPGPFCSRTKDGRYRAKKHSYQFFRDTSAEVCRDVEMTSAPRAFFEHFALRRSWRAWKRSQKVKTTIQTTWIHCYLYRPGPRPYLVQCWSAIGFRRVALVKERGHHTRAPRPGVEEGTRSCSPP